MKTVRFSTLAVAGVLTGMTLEETAAGIHDVFEHVFPGIGPFGMTVANAKLIGRLYKQFPGLKGYIDQAGPPKNDGSLDRWIEDLEAAFPDGFDIEGGD